MIARFLEDVEINDGKHRMVVKKGEEMTATNRGDFYELRRKDGWGTMAPKLFEGINYEIIENPYTKGNTDNIEKAVGALDTFTKNWCMNCEETEKRDDLVFRCNECEFRGEEGKCLIKMFANNHKRNYDMSKFGSMSR